MEIVVAKEVNTVEVEVDKETMEALAAESPVLKEMIEERLVLTEVDNERTEAAMIDKEVEAEPLNVAKFTFVEEIAVDNEVTLAAVKVVTEVMALVRCTISVDNAVDTDVMADALVDTSVDNEADK